MHLCDALDRASHDITFDPLILYQRTNFRLSKLKEFADDNFEFDENGRKFSKQVENTVGKGFVLQTRKNQGLFGKGLIVYQTTKF